MVPLNLILFGLELCTKDCEGQNGCVVWSILCFLSSLNFLSSPLLSPCCKWIAIQCSVSSLTSCDHGKKVRGRTLWGVWKTSSCYLSHIRRVYCGPRGCVERPGLWRVIKAWVRSVFSQCRKNTHTCTHRLAHLHIFTEHLKEKNKKGCSARPERKARDSKRIQTFYPMGQQWPCSFLPRAEGPRSWLHIWLHPGDGWRKGSS